LRNRKLEFSKPFDKIFRQLPANVRELTYEKLELFLANPAHPSLRVKQVKGTHGIWEMSVNMNYRITFEVWPEKIYLRRIGTHDILRHP